MQRIEVLSVKILNTARPILNQFRERSYELGIGLGWHYLLDLCWTAEHVATTGGTRVLDAGAGYGIIQWWLADQGLDVLSVDRLCRRNLPWYFRQRYRVRGLRENDLAPLYQLLFRNFLPPRSPRFWYMYPQQVLTCLREWRHKTEVVVGRGTVFFYNQDLKQMPDIQDCSVDTVVSISALEHNSPAGLRASVTELMRVLKPGGKMIATLGAAKEQDWFHEPSQGWCYTEATLRDIFDLPADCPSNYDTYDELFRELRDCSELRDNLADFYFKSGNNGMPWGVWDPKYVPVGVIKVKPT